MKTRTALLSLAFSALAGVAALAVLVPTLNAGPAQAEPASPPSCRCSAATSLAGSAMNVYHCQCGVLACAVLDTQRGNSPSPVMQCVKE